MLLVGHRLKIHKDGSTVFVIVEVGEDGRPLVEPIGDAPGKYAFTVDPAYVVAADSETGDT